MGTKPIYDLYADQKTTHPLGLRLYKKRCTPTRWVSYQSRLWTHRRGIAYCSVKFVTHLETYEKEWVSTVKSDEHVPTVMSKSISTCQQSISSGYT